MKFLFSEMCFLKEKKRKPAISRPAVACENSAISQIRYLLWFRLVFETFARGRLCKNLIPRSSGQPKQLEARTRAPFTSELVSASCIQVNFGTAICRRSSIAVTSGLA